MNSVLKVLSLEPLDALPLNLSTRPKEEEVCLDARCEEMRDELRASFFGAPRDSQSKRFFDELTAFYERDGRLLATALHDTAPANWTAARWLAARNKKRR